MTPTSGIERTFIDAMPEWTMPEWTFRLFRPVLLATRDLPWYSDATAKRSNRDNMMEIKAQQFVTSTGRQVLTDNGQQGMGGVAEAIFANCAELDNDQLNEIIESVRLYQR
ncbi:hypothetical protein PX983_RS23105 [Escherichia coli]